MWVIHCCLCSFLACCLAPSVGQWVAGLFARFIERCLVMWVKFCRFCGSREGLTSMQVFLYFSRDHWSERSSLLVESCACEHGEPDSSMPLECYPSPGSLLQCWKLLWAKLVFKSGYHRIWIYLLVAQNVSGPITAGRYTGSYRNRSSVSLEYEFFIYHYTVI